MKAKHRNIKEFLKILIYVFLFIPIYGYLTFYFVYPTIGMIPLAPYGWTGWLLIIYSVILGIVGGILILDPQHAFMMIFVSSILGYGLGLVYHSFPAYIYGYTIYVNGWEYFNFISLSWILLAFYILLGMIGVFIGGAIRERIE